MNKQKQLAIYLILLIALVIRIGLAVVVYGDMPSEPTWYDWPEYPVHLEKDPTTYLMGAKQIIETGSNTFNFFPPLHFLFLAGCLYLGNGNMLFPIFANVLVSWFVVVAIYLLTKSLYGERTALIAASISGFYPNFIMYGLSVHPEMLTLFWIVISFLMLVRYFHTASWFYLVLSGVLWGLASQTRGGLYIFSFFVVIAIMVSLWGRKPTMLVKTIGIFLVATYTTILSIAIIAFPIHGDLSLNSKTGVGAVILGVNRITNACTDYGHIRGNIHYGILPEEEWPEGSRLNPLELVQLNPRQIFPKLVTFISQDPLAYVKNSLNKLSCLWSPNQLIIKYFKIIVFMDSNSPAVNPLCLGMGFIYVLIVCSGLCGSVLAKGPFRLLFILFLLFYNILIFLAVGNAKLRLPLMPFFMIYCACFMTGIFKRTSWKKLLSSKWLMVILVLFIGNSIYKSREFLLLPAEACVRTIELHNELGFPKTALLKIRNSRSNYTFTQNQKERILHTSITAFAESYMRKIEHSYASGFFRKVLYYINEYNNKEVRYDFSKEQKERLIVLQRNALAEIKDTGRREQRNDSEPFEPLRTEDREESPWSEHHWLEAECADSIIEPLAVANDENASEGKYIFSFNGQGNQYVPGSVMARYKVTIVKGGEFLLWGRVKATNEWNNSFFIQIDGGLNNCWEVGIGDHWQWHEVNNYPVNDLVKFTLTKGVHTIGVKLREDGTKLDKLLLTNDLAFVPKNKGNTAENSGYSEDN